MKIYRLTTVILLLSFFCFFLRTADKNPHDFPVTSRGEQKYIDENFQAPFNLVFHFYQAVEKNDWDSIRAMVTAIWWAEMHRSGFKQKWQSLVAEDPTVNFVMFLVSDQKVDLEDGQAWIRGKVDWVSTRQKMNDEHETIFFVREPDGWKINSIQVNWPVETVETFYEMINEGKFHRMAAFLVPKYRDLLERSEVISSLKSDWKKNRTGVYCVFYLRSFQVRIDSAWVSGEVLWNPLTGRERETPVTIFLKRNGDWKIEKITGHWEISK